MKWIPLILAIVLAVVHFYASELHFLDRIPRSRWLSAAGGVSVAYVFVHLIPDLASRQAMLMGTLQGWLAAVEHHVWFLALLGLMVYYGLELVARTRRREAAADSHAGQSRPFRRESDQAVHSPFWLHLVFYVLYNAIIGNLLVAVAADPRQSVWLFGVAMALHFVVVDYGMHQHFSTAYHNVGRHILSAAVVLGSLVGLTVALPKGVESILVAFLAGGIILNVLKEELPEERESRFLPFLIGGGAYAVLISFT